MLKRSLPCFSVIFSGIKLWRWEFVNFKSYKLQYKHWNRKVSLSLQMRVQNDASKTCVWGGVSRLCSCWHCCPPLLPWDAHNDSFEIDGLTVGRAHDHIFLCGDNGRNPACCLSIVYWGRLDWNPGSLCSQKETSRCWTACWAGCLGVTTEPWTMQGSPCLST